MIHDTLMILCFGTIELSLLDPFVGFGPEFYDARMEFDVIASFGRGYLDRRVSKVCFDLIIEHLLRTEYVQSLLHPVFCGESRRTLCIWWNGVGA